MTQACGSREAAFEQFPFLISYHDELAEHGLEGQTLDEAVGWWRVRFRALLKCGILSISAGAVSNRGFYWLTLTIVTSLVTSPA